MTGSAGVGCDLNGPVATVTLRRSQAPEVWQALREVGRSLTGDVRAVVVRGSFSAGPDSLSGLSEDQLASYQEGFGWLRRPDLVSVAAVRGPAVAAGFQLALACDLRVVAAEASFSMAEIGQGLVPGFGGTKRLVELIGYARALELCLTARRVGAEEAYRIGLASLVVPAAELDGAVADLVSALLAAPRGPVAELKALLAAAAGHSYPRQLAAEREALARLLRDPANPGD